MKTRRFSKYIALFGGLGLFILASPASAGWGSYGSYGSHGSSGGSWGGHTHRVAWGSHGSSGSHGSYGSSGSHGSSGHVGPLRRLFAHWHAKKAARRAYWGSHGSSGGSSGWASHGSSGGSHGSYGSHGSSGGSHGSSGGSHGGHMQMESSPAEAPAEADGSEVPAEPTDSARRSSEGVLQVNLPAKAKIFVNGRPTRLTGESRRFVAPNLRNGKQYVYNVKAEMVRDGEVVEQTKQVTIHPGRTTELAFDFQPEVDTSLTLLVPEDAKVVLSGTNTKATGAVRKFSTNRIAKGAKWTEYHVQVSVDRGGKTITQEKQIAINGGDQLELAFKFDQAAEDVTKVAAAK